MEWISVEDKLPENGQLVLCAYDDIGDYWNQITTDGHGRAKMNKGYIVRQLKTEDGQRWADEGVTHWMPLPEPPE